MSISHTGGVKIGARALLDIYNWYGLAISLAYPSEVEGGILLHLLKSFLPADAKPGGGGGGEHPVVWWDAVPNKETRHN